MEQENKNTSELKKADEKEKPIKKKIDWKFFATLGVSALAIALSIASICKKSQPGPAGENGIAGLNGSAGTNGKSAYEIAKAGGYTGSETEWIASLKRDGYCAKFVKDEDLISSGTLYGQHSYDGHNFLQFRYSEPVDIDTGDGKTVILSSDVKENVPVSEKMGQIDVSEGYLSVKGL